MHKRGDAQWTSCAPDTLASLTSCSAVNPDASVASTRRGRRFRRRRTCFRSPSAASWMSRRDAGKPFPSLLSLSLLRERRDFLRVFPCLGMSRHQANDTAWECNKYDYEVHEG